MGGARNLKLRREQREGKGQEDTGRQYFLCGEPVVV